jgi:hypothetical protein
MSADLTPIAGKLGCLVRLLSSDRDGEVIAAARAIARMLKAHGADIHVLADRVEHANGNGKPSAADLQRRYDAGFAAGKAAAESHEAGNALRDADGNPDWGSIAMWCQERTARLNARCQERTARLNAREQEFINSVAAQTVYRDPTERQAMWLKSIFLRLGGKLS